MHNYIFKPLLALVFSASFCTHLVAETATGSTTPVESKIQENQNSQKITEPRIRAQYYSSDAVQALPRLKPLTVQEPEYNKIIFRLEGYPKNKEIILEVKRMANIDPKAYEPKVSFVIQNDGSMKIANSEQQLNAIISSSRGFLPGERVFYRFRTSDGTVDKEISGIPAPAIQKNKDGKTAIKAELLSVNPTVYNIDLPILKEGEEVDFKSTSLGLITKAKPKYSSKQPIRYAPAGDNKGNGGESILEITRKSGESYKIKLPWGSALDSYLKGSKTFSPN